MFTFATLDPRPGADNSALLGPQTLGIEVTIPALAALCGLGNLDPQHAGGDATRAAIEAALTADLPPAGAILATVRPDLDSVGAMAVLRYRAEDGEFEPEMLKRIGLVAAADTFARGSWGGPRALPTTENPWPEAGSASESQPLAAIAASVSDFKVSLDQRVEWMASWISSGAEPEGYRERVEAERLDLVRALESGGISVTTVAEGRIAVVESTHRAAMTIGYASAPIVVALNPAFRLGGGEPHPKFTVAQYQLGQVDLKAASAELAAFEPGWGGSPTICGSPQGVGSTLTTEQVVSVVSRHLK